MMPTEKLSTSISKPAGVLPSMNRSNILMTQPANGPITMAPMSIVVSGAPAMQPITAIAPTMRPRSPPVRYPPCAAMSTGIR